MKTRRFSGFALPTILISSIVMLTVLLVAVSSTAAVRSSLNAQYYNRLSQSAGDAGIAYAKACLAANGNVPLWSDANPLKPNTDCTGAQIAGFTCPENSLDSRCSVLAIGGASIQVLVVGGGGGGGGWGGGGGGGGQQVYDSGINVQQQSYSVVIGKGGIGGGENQTLWNSGIGWDGVDGSGSSFDNISTMGGKGGIAGGAGVSTGGASGSGLFTGGLGGGNSIYEAGGGAGDSGNGVTGLGMLSGNGGIGTANSISGNSVIRSGGGGGGATTQGATAGLGVDGGGNGGSINVGSDGLANFGGGGGGGYNAADGSGWGGRGGSGVVIVSYSTGSITATGGNVTVSGSNTIHTFNDDDIFTVNSLGGNGVISTFSVGLPILGADGKAVDVSSVGTTKLLRTSDNSTWRVYTQTSFYHKSSVSSLPIPVNSIGDITGVTAVGSVLTAGAIDPLAATVDYQWQNADVVTGPYVDISGATASTYTLISSDWKKYIKVVATGSGNYTGTVTSNASSIVSDPSWIAGVVGTPMEGGYVRNADLSSTLQYETMRAFVASPQGEVGLDPDHISNRVLVSPQANPGVDFANYPAQDACKAIGGRLPNTVELHSIYLNQSAYNNGFTSLSYWSSTENDGGTAFAIAFTSGGGTFSYYKDTQPNYVRCVTD